MAHQPLLRSHCLSAARGACISISGVSDQPSVHPLGTAESIVRRSAVVNHGCSLVRIRIEVIRSRTCRRDISRFPTCMRDSGVASIWPAISDIEPAYRAGKGEIFSLLRFAPMAAVATDRLPAWFHESWLRLRCHSSSPPTAASSLILFFDFSGA